VLPPTPYEQRLRVAARHGGSTRPIGSRASSPSRRTGASSGVSPRASRTPTSRPEPGSCTAGCSADPRRAARHCLAARSWYEVHGPGCLSRAGFVEGGPPVLRKRRLLPLPREAGRADFPSRTWRELLQAPWRSVQESSARAHGRLQRTLVRNVAPRPVRCRRWPSAVPRAQRNGRGSPAGSGCAGRRTAGGWRPPQQRLRRCPRTSRWSGHQRPHFWQDCPRVLGDGPAGAEEPASGSSQEHRRPLMPKRRVGLAALRT